MYVYSLELSESMYIVQLSGTNRQRTQVIDLSKPEMSRIFQLAVAKTRRRIPATELARLSNCRLLPLALAKSCWRIPALMSCLFAIGGFCVLQQLNLYFEHRSKVMFQITFLCATAD